MPMGFAIGDRGLGASGDTHPHWIMAHAEVGSYLVVGASAIGKIHLARKLPRDDAFVVRSVGPWLAVAVADGVGTRPLSRYGATYVVEALTALLLRKLVPPVKLAKNKLDTDKMPFSSSSSVEEDFDLKNFVPPPSVDQVTLKASIEFPFSDLGGTDEANASSLQEILPQEFRQVGSIGWWPSPSLSASSSHDNEQSQVQTLASSALASTPTTSQDVVGNDPTVFSKDYDLEHIMRHAFEHTHLGLRQHAVSLEVDITDLSCTALALLFNVETGQAVVGQIGDGALLGLPLQGKVMELVQPKDTGDPQSTYTINRPTFSKYLTIKLIEPTPDNPYIAFYIMTDGLSGDLLFTPTPPDNWAKGIKENLQVAPSPATAAARMLNWLSTYQVKGSWDDRTLVVIMQRERRDGDNQPATR